MRNTFKAHRVANKCRKMMVTNNGKIVRRKVIAFGIVTNDMALLDSYLLHNLHSKLENTITVNSIEHLKELLK
jgi:hypothetical protein